MASEGEPTLKILVVDDNAVNRKIALAMLKHLGYAADEAKDGHEVLAILETKWFDLIFMDVQMPKMDGVEATRKIREKYLGRKPRIVAVTTDSNRVACLACGMNDYMMKPVSISAFKSIIDSKPVAL